MLFIYIKMFVVSNNCKKRPGDTHAHPATKRATKWNLANSLGEHNILIPPTANGLS